MFKHFEIVFTRCSLQYIVLRTGRIETHIVTMALVGCVGGYAGNSWPNGDRFEV